MDVKSELAKAVSISAKPESGQIDKIFSLNKGNELLLSSMYPNICLEGALDIPLIDIGSLPVFSIYVFIQPKPTQK